MTNSNENTKQIGSGMRLGSMLLDHLFMSMIMMVFFVPGIISGIGDAFSMSHEQPAPDFMGGWFGYFFLLGFAVYFCKDCINGRSIAKRILKLQVVDNATGQVASPVKCFVRNIFIMIWPIEVLIALTNTSRRLGDRVAGTKLVMFNSELEQPKVNIIQVVVSIALAYGLMLLFMLPFKALSSSMKVETRDYIESSYNSDASKQLEQLLTDSLGNYVVPSVKIYDKVDGRNLKYISVILQMKENYFEEGSTYEELKSITTALIYSKYPKKTFTGKTKYVFKSARQMQSASLTIGSEPEPQKKE